MRAVNTTGALPPKRQDLGRCWAWTGKVSNSGYGVYGGRSKGAHRVSYELYVGPIPDKLTVDHLCENKTCVNPAHLEAVTQSENLRRRDASYGIRSAKTECPHGHAYSEENTARRQGRRHCKTCDRERAARNREKTSQ